VQQKYLSEHTATARIVVLHQAESNLQTDASQSQESLCVRIKTANRRGKMTSRQNSYDMTSTLTSHSLSLNTFLAFQSSVI
jgi:hypothetical protein